MAKISFSLLTKYSLWEDIITHFDRVNKLVLRFAIEIVTKQSVSPVPNKLDEGLKSRHDVLPKWLFCQNGNFISKLDEKFCCHKAAEYCSQSRLSQISLMKVSKVGMMCCQNDYFVKRENKKICHDGWRYLSPTGIFLAENPFSFWCLINSLDTPNTKIELKVCFGKKSIIFAEHVWGSACGTS